MIKPTKLFKLPQDILMNDQVKLPTAAETKTVVERFKKALDKVMN